MDALMFASLQDSSRNNTNTSSSASSLSIHEYLSLSSNNTSVNSNSNDKNFIDSNLLSFHKYDTSNNLQDTNDIEVGTSTQSKSKYPNQELNNDFLQYIDSEPAKPPSYKSISNKNQKINFPIFENNIPVSKDALPPKYTPAVNEIIIVALKMERISPYEPSTSRSWKDVVLEINSTQLNFYTMPDSLSKKWSKIIEFNPDFANNNTKDSSNNNIKKLLDHIKRHRNRYLVDSAIFKTYTLQYATFGIPVDYHKKAFVLRMRCEIEQFLLNFYHVDNLIIWSMYLSIGISVSLDLDFRQLPDYRIVPRRRRRRHRRNIRKLRHHFHKVPNINSGNTDNAFANSSNEIFNNNLLSTRLRSYSFNSLIPHHNSRTNLTTTKIEKMLGITDSTYLDVPTSYKLKKINTSTVGGTNSLKFKLVNIFGNNNLKVENKQNKGQSVGSFLGLRNNHSNNNTAQDTIKFGSSAKFRDRSNSTPTRNRHRNISVEIVNEIINEGNESFDETAPITMCDEAVSNDDNSSGTEEDDDDCTALQEGTDNTHSVYLEEGIYHDDSDDDDDDHGDDDDDDNDSDETTFAIERNNSLFTYSTMEYGCYETTDYKWSPTRREVTRKRYIRDSLRCIKPFVENQEWIGHVVFKPTKEPIFKTNNEPIWIDNYNNNKLKLKYLSINKYSQMKNHYLKAYIVGNVGLIRADSKMVYRTDNTKQLQFF